MSQETVAPTATPTPAPVTPPSSTPPGPAAPPVPGEGGGESGGAGGPAAEAPTSVLAGGEEASDATSGPGDGTARSNDLRAAQHILGDFVGVKNLYLGAERRVRLTRISSQLTAEVKHAYVKPADWGDLHSRFERQNTVVLCGAAGTGRTATAVRLLQAAQVSTVYELEPDVDLLELAELLDAERRRPERLQPGAAFLLQEPADVDRLRGTVLHGLSEALATTGRLVVTVGVNAMLLDDEVQRHVIHLPTRPELFTILQAHLRWRVGDTRADADLGREGVAELIEELLADGATCVVAAQLAEWLSWEPEDGFSLDRIRAGMARGTGTFAEWFDGLPDLGTRTLGIALAALDGLPYADVARAAASLSRRLEQTDSTAAVALVTAAPDPTEKNVAQRLRLLPATTGPGEVRLPLGTVPTTVVAYRRDTVANQILERAWLGYQIQDELLEWLCELVDDPSERVGLFAATSIGALAILSFDRVWYGAIGGLGRHESPRRRQAAAVALKAVAAREDLRPVVTAAIAQWWSSGDRAQQASAARAHGLILGQQDLGSTLDALGRLASIDHIQTAGAIGHALVDLLIAAPDGAVGPVYAALLRWMDDPARATVAHLCFAIVAVNTVTFVDSESAGTTRTTWPALLWLATQQAELRQPLFTLWHRILDESILLTTVENALTIWASRAEADEQVRQAYARMVRAVAKYGERTRQSLRRLAREWVDPDRLAPLPRVAASVAAVLETQGGSS
jgi:hypothetical protein